MKKRRAKTIKRGRDSATGTFVPVSVARAHPATTTVETRRPKRK